MNRTRTLLVMAVLGLVGGAAGARQSAPLEPVQSVGAERKASGMAENAFRAQLRIRRDVRPDGTVVAVVTNVSKATFTFTGYGPTSPQYQVEDLGAGGWTPRALGWCGLGRGLQAIKPGQTRTLGLGMLEADKASATRYWLIFTDAASKKSSRMLLESAAK